MCHSASTGYSISRSLREAPVIADAISKAVRTLDLVGERSASVWDALWPQEKRKRVGQEIRLDAKKKVELQHLRLWV